MFVPFLIVNLWFLIDASLLLKCVCVCFGCALDLNVFPEIIFNESKHCLVSNKFHQFIIIRNALIINCPFLFLAYKMQVIPFSIAIKRMSEILLYKAQECVAKLTEAQDGISSEMQELDSNSDRTCEQIEASFAQLQDLVEQRKHQLLEFTKSTAEDKRQVLQKQMALLAGQRNEVESQCNGLPQYQLDVRNLSRKISELSSRLESLGKAQELQENCFIQFEPLEESSVSELKESLQSLGQIRTSRTCPAKCQLTVGKCAAHLRTTAILTTFDYAGQEQKIGGEPVQAQLRHVASDELLQTNTVDLRCGRYEVHFVPNRPGEYELIVKIFDRPVQQFPLRFEAAAHINPLCIYGATGTDAHQFRRPVALAVDPPSGHLYILDTGNCRVKVLCPNACSNSPFNLLRHLTSQPVLENGACTGLALRTHPQTQRPLLLLSNWKTRVISELDAESGQLKREITCNQLQEPTCVAVNRSGELIVVDNGAGCVFVFDADGKLRFKVPSQCSGLSTVVKNF